MNLFTHIANLITSVVRPEKAAFTTVIYPSQGKAVVVHDGLVFARNVGGIRSIRWKMGTRVRRSTASCRITLTGLIHLTR